MQKHFLPIFAAALVAPLTALSFLARAAADEPTGLDFDPATYKSPSDKAKATVADGKFGKALKLEFADDCRGVFVAGRSRGQPAWDQAAGFSFWVKGDGSDHLGALEIVWNEDYALRYAATFPLKNTDWRKITVAWRDLLPETSKPDAKPIDAKSGNAPSKLGAIWFGKWWYWRDAKAHSYSVDGLKLEATIPENEADALKVTGASHEDPLSRLAGKLKAGKPIKIVAMGDSLTDYAHWSNREVNWPTLLKAELEKKYRGQVTIVNPAIGGTELRQNLVLLPEWATKNADADLVTICFGGNDWNAGARGPDFEASLKQAVRLIRRATAGKADVLIMTTCPQLAMWDTMGELADAGRKAADASRPGLADIYAAFHKAGEKEADRAALFAWDHVHLSKSGHELFVATILAAIEQAKGR